MVLKPMNEAQKQKWKEAAATTPATIRDAANTEWSFNGQKVRNVWPLRPEMKDSNFWVLEGNNHTILGILEEAKGKIRLV